MFLHYKQYSISYLLFLLLRQYKFKWLTNKNHHLPPTHSLAWARELRGGRLLIEC